MKIGYACICDEAENMKFKTCRMRNATNEKLIVLIAHNLRALDAIVEYNYAHGILLYRISSDLIPFGSSSINKLAWQSLFHEQFQALGIKIKNYGMRVSMHPGQYTILNSPRGEVVERAIEDLHYHSLLLNLMELDTTHKIILHIGGVYGDKKSAIDRFIKEYKQLDSRIKKRLVIENDDRNYHVEDVLQISKLLHIPVVFDNLHHSIHFPSRHLDDGGWLALCKDTWEKSDGNQKMHYSEQHRELRLGAHAEHIDIKEFAKYCKHINRKDLDIMLEVKDKHHSALACIERIKEQCPDLLEKS